MDDEVVQRVFQERGRDYIQQPSTSTSSSSSSILQSLPLHVVSPPFIFFFFCLIYLLEIINVFSCSKYVDSGLLGPFYFFNEILGYEEFLIWIDKFCFSYFYSLDELGYVCMIGVCINSLPFLLILFIVWLFFFSIALLWSWFIRFRKLVLKLG